MLNYIIVLLSFFIIVLLLLLKITKIHLLFLQISTFNATQAVDYVGDFNLGVSCHGSSEYVPADRKKSSRSTNNDADQYYLKCGGKNKGFD